LVLALSSCLESILHSTLLLITAASMAYAFAKFYGGRVNYHSTTTTLGGGGRARPGGPSTWRWGCGRWAWCRRDLGAAAARGEGDCRGNDGTDAGSLSSSRERRRRRDGNDGRARTTGPSPHRRCTIRPREDRNMSCLLVFLLAITQAIPFCGMDGNTTARIINERWQWSLPWVLRTYAVMPVTVSFFGCIAFQHRYLVPLCTRASYIIIGQDGVISLVCADFFQLLLASSASCFGLSCGPEFWKFLPCLCFSPRPRALRSGS
jgi:hypothetical protein